MESKEQPEERAMIVKNKAGSSFLPFLYSEVRWKGAGKHSHTCSYLEREGETLETSKCLEVYEKCYTRACLA